MAFAKAFKGLKFWSRDIIFVFPEDNKALESWLEAYHGKGTSKLDIRSGAIQSALCLEICGDYCYGAMEDFKFQIEGPNGLLPNLDFVNTMVRIGEHREIKIAAYPDSNPVWKNKHLQHISNIFCMILRQALGFPVHVNGPFLKYSISAVVLSGREGARRENDDFHLNNIKHFYEYAEQLFKQLVLCF